MMHLPCCAATYELISWDRAIPCCTPSRSITRAPTGRIELKYDEDQIQKQSTTLWWTNVNYHDKVKNDGKT